MYNYFGQIWSFSIKTLNKSVTNYR